MVHVMQDLQSCLHRKGLKRRMGLGLVEPVFINQPKDNQKVEETQEENALMGISVVPFSVLFNNQTLEQHLAAKHISYLGWAEFLDGPANHLEEPAATIDRLYMSGYKAAVPCPDPGRAHRAEFNGVEFVAREVRCINEAPREFFTTVIRDLCDSKFLPSSIGLEFRMPGGNMMHTTMNWGGYRLLRAPFRFSNRVNHQAQEFIDTRLALPFLSVHWRRGLRHYNQMASPEDVMSVMTKGLSQCRCSTVFLMTNSGTDRDVQIIHDRFVGIRIVQLYQSSGWENALMHLTVEMAIASRAAYFIPFRSSLVSRMIAEHRLLIHALNVRTILDTPVFGGDRFREQVFWWKQQLTEL